MPAMTLRTSVCYFCSVKSLSSPGESVRVPASYKLNLFSSCQRLKGGLQRTPVMPISNNNSTIARVRLFLLFALPATLPARKATGVRVSRDASSACGHCGQRSTTIIATETVRWQIWLIMKSRKINEQCW